MEKRAVIEPGRTPEPKEDRKTDAPSEGPIKSAAQEERFNGDLTKKASDVVAKR
jgi:hypothetical protein